VKSYQSSAVIEVQEIRNVTIHQQTNREGHRDATEARQGNYGKPVLLVLVCRDFVMPAKSKAQQKAAGAALSAKRGETPKKLTGASKEMVDSMSEKQRWERY
jgi:hypothetical protein